MDQDARTDKLGTACFELQPGALAHALGILEKGLEAMVKSNPGLAGMIEIQINNQLRPHLAYEARYSDPKVNLVAEGAVYSDDIDDDYSATKTGEPDFRFTFVEQFGECEKYLAIECKLVSGIHAGNYASNYVDDGVLRFVDCTYSRGHASAVMTGYVFEGDPAAAAAFVAKALTGKAEMIALLDGFAPATDLPHHGHLYASNHRQRETCVHMRLMHLFRSLN
ncbi:MAG: hypothetical protein KKI08_26300 [Armatimonadetes bacterium]|nr:hypothetical protein [Armatimonadota bacterium]